MQPRKTKCRNLSTAARWLVFLCVALLTLGLSACGGDGTGMSRPMDGSSSEAFQQSMSTLKTELTAEQYGQLRSSVNYLQLQAFDAPTVADFYLTLDGKTPQQIIDQANSQRNDNGP